MCYSGSDTSQKEFFQATLAKVETSRTIQPGFPAGSVEKESTCNAGDMGSIPGLGRYPGEGNGNPLQYSCLENPVDRGAWWAVVHRVTQSRTRLKRLSSSSSSSSSWTQYCSELSVEKARNPSDLLKYKNNYLGFLTDKIMGLCTSGKAWYMFSVLRTQFPLFLSPSWLVFLSVFSFPSFLPPPSFLSK